MCKKHLLNFKQEKAYSYKPPLTWSYIQASSLFIGPMHSVYHTIGTMILELREALRNRPFVI
jgi:hypothetical protein